MRVVQDTPRYVSQYLKGLALDIYDLIRSFSIDSNVPRHECETAVCENPDPFWIPEIVGDFR